METIAVRRKDNDKIKIMLPENFDQEKHELIGLPEDEAAPVETPKRGRKPKE